MRTSSLIALVAVSLPLAACAKKKEAPPPAALPAEGATAAVAPGAAADPLPNAPALPADQVVEAKAAEFVALLPKRPKAEVEERSTSIRVSGLSPEPISIDLVDEFYGTKEVALASEDKSQTLEVSQFEGPGRYLSISANDKGWRFVVATVALDEERMLSCTFNAAVSADEAKQVLDYCKAVGVRRPPVATPGPLATFDLAGVKVQLPTNEVWHIEPAGQGHFDVQGVINSRLEVSLADWGFTDTKGALDALTPNQIVEGGTVSGGRFTLIDAVSPTEFKAYVADRIDDQRSVVCGGERLGSLVAAKRALAFCQGMKLVK